MNSNKKDNKDNLCVKIFRFFFPKGGYKANFESGKDLGTRIGQQKRQELINKDINKKK